jgi:outer membrane receptor protein involved in Fe transport
MPAIMAFHWQRWLVLFPLAVTGGVACAADSESSEGGEGVASIVVSAARSGDTLLQDMPLHTTVLSQADIENSPAQTLDQLLRNVPGLLIPGAPAYTTDPTGQNIKFRGMDKKVLVLVDGIPVLDPFYTTIQWFKVPLSSVERVEIVRGGGSSLWGNLAVGGVINIISKRPTTDDGEVSVRGGNRNTWNGAISKDFVFSERLSLNFAADGATSEGYNTALPGLRAAFWPGRDSSAANSQNVRIGVYFAPTADLNGFLRVGYHRLDEDIGGYRYGDNVQKSPDLQASVTRLFGEHGRLVADVYTQYVRFDKFNGAGCYAAATFSCGAPAAGNGATRGQQSADVLQYATSHDINTYRERGASLVYSKGMDWMLRDLQLGVDYRAISGDDSQSTYRTPTAGLPGVFRVQRTNSGSGGQAFAGLFTQLKWVPVAPLEITFAARIDTYNSSDGIALQTDYSNTAAPVSGAPTGGPLPSSHKTAFDPSLSLRYAVSDGLALRGSIYKGFRAPGLNNLYRSFGSNSISISNPLLGPETLVAGELGLDWRAEHYTLSATLFEAQVDHVVATYSITTATPIPAAVQAICGPGYIGAPNASCPGTVSFYTNGQNQHSSGIELDGTWMPHRDVSVGLYATGTKAYYTSTSTGDPTDRQLPLIPRYVAGANLTWQMGSRWTHYAELRYNSSMLLSSLTTTPLLRQGSYVVLNLNTSWHLGKSLDLSASLVNALDRKYSDTSANNPQNVSLSLPRTVTVGLRARF